MYRYLLLLLIICGALACRSSKKALQEGYYSEAIKKSVKELQKDPNQREEIIVLTEAFKRGQQKDLEQIDYLKLEGPNNWERIYEILLRVKDKQDLVKTLPVLSLDGKPVNFPFLSLDERLIDARQKAAEYLYVRGQESFRKKDKMSNRAAHEDFLKVKRYHENYKDVNELISISRKAGTSNVVFRILNNSNQPLPPDFENRFESQLQVQNFDKKWVKYYFEDESGIEFDYSINLKINRIEVSPESVFESRFSESKKVQNGTEYKLDEKGNVMKDAKGNDIKIPKYVEISCTVLETKQSKAARIFAEVEFYNFARKKYLKIEPLQAESIFEHYSALPLGNVEALSPESREKIRNTPVPFPSNREIIMQTTSHLNQVIKDIIKHNDDLLQ